MTADSLLAADVQSQAQSFSGGELAASRLRAAGGIDALMQDIKEIPHKHHLEVLFFH